MTDFFTYQLVGADFLAANKVALLADEMGLGKSAQAIRASDIVNAQSILVICPAAVRINWAREFQRFSVFAPQCTVIGSKDKLSKFGVTVISYDYMAKTANKNKIKALHWDVVILDEAHYLKSAETKRTKSIYGADMKSGIKSTWLWMLSGTPAPNNVTELWPHLAKANITPLKYWEFTKHFTTGRQTDYGYIPLGTRNAEELKTILNRFMLRRKKEDVMKDLPPIMFTDVAIERSPVELHPYFSADVEAAGDTPTFLSQIKKASEGLAQTLSALENATLTDVLSVLQGLEVSNATLRRYIGMAKVPTFAEIIRAELEEHPEMKIVIFAVHKSVIELLLKLFRCFSAVALYGETTPASRQISIDRFQNEPQTRVFIGNVKAAGTGITLTSAAEVAFIEASYNPADNAQAAMRCHRIGQKKPVRVRFFSCANSSDELIMDALRRKTAELAKIF